MKTLTIRGIDSELSEAIKKLAAKQNESVNKFILNALKKLTGLSQNTAFQSFNDLDGLAGGWSENDENYFLEHFPHKLLTFNYIPSDLLKHIDTLTPKNNALQSHRICSESPQRSIPESLESAVYCPSDRGRQITHRA